MVKRELTPRHAAAEMRGFVAAGEACGVLFGPERTGLVNDDIALADTVLTVPLNPAFSSLNLAQAVLLVGYEWFVAPAAAAADETLHTGHSRPANKAELLRFFDHFEEALVLSGFLRHPDKRPEHDAQPAQPVSARAMHRAGIAHPARRRHRLPRTAPAQGHRTDVDAGRRRSARLLRRNRLVKTRQVH